MFSILYPLSLNIFKSLARLDGLQEMYRILGILDTTICSIKSFESPNLGGSTVIKSGLSLLFGQILYLHLIYRKIRYLNYLF